MPKLRNILFIVIIVFGFWHFYGETLKTSGTSGVFEKVQTDFISIKEHPKVKHTIDYFQSQIQHLLQPSPQQELEQQDVEKPKLHDPDEQTFSIYNIELGDRRADVEQQTGASQRSTENEYGLEWEAYHENYHNFIMVAYDENDLVVGLYTNQDLISSNIDVTYGSAQDTVHEWETDPLPSIRKGLITYQINANDEYELFLADDHYIMIFYDQQQDDTVTALLLVSESMEERKEQIYGEPSDPLKEGFEYQLFDLTNAARVQNGLPALDWNQDVMQTARGHSRDMAENNYFDHTDLEGQSPFDRMEADDIAYHAAGENIAMGQFSSILAHEGLMNSSDHRENILQQDFQTLGVGVAFNDEGQPYFTENFLTP